MAAPDPISLDDFAAIPDPARGLGARPTPAAPPPGDPSPTRAERRRRNLVAAGFGLSWVVFLVAHLGLRGNIADAGLLASLGLWTLLAVGGLALALRTDARGLPPSLRVVQIVLLGVAALYVVGVLVRDATAPNVPIHWSNVIGCLSWAHLLAVGPLLVAALVFRRSFLSFPAWRGAVVGAACGLGGAIGIHTHCVVETASHVLVAHGLVIAVSALLGAALGARAGRL
ncbi:MAG: NrsF family protein [Byssovorax sp.]